MADYDVQIRISADGTAAIQSVSRVQNAFRTMGTQGGQSMRQLGNESRGLLGNIRSLESGVQTLMGGFVGHQAIQAIGRLREIGDQARFARLAFEEMAGGPDRAVTALNQLREATGGVIDDVTLMTQSTRLQLLGLADGAQEAGELFATLSKIARITGQTIDSALSTFQLTIANESFMRLDSLGLSVEAVKDRIDELKESGLSASDAFRQAVIEGMEGVVEKIGDAATAGETAFARMQTRIENMKNELAEFVAQGIEAGAQLAELARLLGLHATGNLPHQREAADRLFARTTVITESLLAGEFRDVSPDFMEEFVRKILDDLARNPDLAAQAELTGEQIAKWVEEGMQSHLIGETQMRFGDNLQTVLANIALQTFRFNQNMDAASEIQARRIADLQNNLRELQALEPVLRQRFLEGPRDAIRDAIGAVLNPSRLSEARATEAAQRLAALHFSSRTGFFRPDDVREAQNLVAVFEQAYDRLTELHKAGRVSDSIFEGFKAAADQVREWADEIERGAEALRNLSLDQMHGVGVINPALADATSALERFLRDEGMDDEEIDTLVDMLDLRSGRQTELSQRFESEILPGIRDIYNQFGREAAAAALEAYVEGRRSAVETGQMPADPFLLTGYMRVGGGGPSVTVQPGWGHLAVAQALGMSLEDLYAQGILRPDQMLHPGDVIGGGGKLIALNELTKRGGPAWSWGGPADTAGTGDMVTDSERISTALENAATSVERMPGALEPVVDSLGEGVTLADIIRETLETIAATEYEVRLAVTADASDIPQWLYSLIDSRIMQLNRATGSPPGSDPRRGGAGGRATRLG